MNILIVEDDVRLASALKKILEDNAHSVDVVHDGQAGVDYGASSLYDVIILDVMLPKKDGFTVTAEGIETQEMADALAGIGCNHLQGYLFDRPLPIDEFVKKYGL